jgi:hypothetical protein
VKPLLKQAASGAERRCGGGKPSQDRAGVHDGRAGHDEQFVTARPYFGLVHGSHVMHVSSADGRHHATGIEDRVSHAEVRTTAVQ